MANWLETIQGVKSEIAKQKPNYSQDNWISVTHADKTFNIRTDCSGFVTGVLKFMNILSKSANATSKSFTATVFKELENNGFKSIPFTKWEDLKSGDIIALDGHVEIFAYIKDGKNYVFNAGSNSSINSATPTVSTHVKYTTVWRPNDAGKFVGDLAGMEYSLVKDETVVENTKEKNETSSSKPVTSKVPYLVKVSIKNLLIRRNAGTNYHARIKNGRYQYTGVGIFTIVAEKTDKSGKKWGLLKSYENSKDGWICLDYVTKV